MKLHSDTVAISILEEVEILSGSHEMRQRCTILQIKNSTKTDGVWYEPVRENFCPAKAMRAQIPAGDQSPLQNATLA